VRDSIRFDGRGEEGGDGSLLAAIFLSGFVSGQMTIVLSCACLSMRVGPVDLMALINN
jgi:hypothetical protein